MDLLGGAVVKNPSANAGDMVRVLVQEDPTYCGATKPISHNYWAREPQLLIPCATTTEAHMPRAHAPQQKKSSQWEAHTPQWRVASACCK